MAITTVDQANQGKCYPIKIYKSGAIRSTSGAGTLCTFVYSAGNPSPPSNPSDGMAGAALSGNTTGYLNYTNHPTGYTYLHSLSGQVTTGSLSQVKGGIVIADRLWQQSGIDVTNTSSQTINSVAFPPRDSNGTINGEGVMIALIATSTLGAAPSTSMTIDYTNSANVASRTGTISSIPTLETGASVRVAPFCLAAGDTGVKSIQSINIGASMVSGSVSLVAYRIITMIGDVGIYKRDYADIFECGFPRIYDDSLLEFMFYSFSTTTINCWGTINLTQG
jgi:hypothetical protein